ncbi:MAG: hypothetical protein HY516_00685 [Candidatus Aenigmarchaeota archaeon]|nr:hypothetical protein [Candidatus Aenigmarchaeota archaeon]
MDIISFQASSQATVASSIFKFLEKYQAQELIVPFLLTFVIAYGVLDSIRIFQKPSINAIVALSISFYAIFYGPYGSMGKFLTQLYGTSAVVLAGLVVIMILLGALSLGGRHRPGAGVFERLFGTSGGVTVAAIITVVFIFLLATGWFSNVGIKLDSDTTALLIIVLVIFLFIYIVARPGHVRRWWDNMPWMNPQEGHF